MLLLDSLHFSSGMNIQLACFVYVDTNIFCNFCYLIWLLETLNIYLYFTIINFMKHEYTSNVPNMSLDSKLRCAGSLNNVKQFKGLISKHQ